MVIASAASSSVHNIPERHVTTYLSVITGVPLVRKRKKQVYSRAAPRTTNAFVSDDPPSSSDFQRETIARAYHIITSRYEHGAIIDAVVGGMPIIRSERCGPDDAIYGRVLLRNII